MSSLEHNIGNALGVNYMHPEWIEELAQLVGANLHLGTGRQTWTDESLATEQWRRDQSLSSLPRYPWDNKDSPWDDEDSPWADIDMPEDQDEFMVRLQDGLDQLELETAEEEDARKRRVDEYCLQKIECIYERHENYKSKIKEKLLRSNKFLFEYKNEAERDAAFSMMLMEA